MRGKEVLDSRIKGNSVGCVRNEETRQNIIGDYEYYMLCFYAGDFEKVKQVSTNPNGSLGWCSSFIRLGIRLMLLYLYEEPLPSKVAAAIAKYAEFQDDGESSEILSFESEKIEESRKHKMSVFWNYFKRWKQYFQMEEKERKRYLTWAKRIVHDRADAIVGGKYKNHYRRLRFCLQPQRK